MFSLDLLTSVCATWIPEFADKNSLSAPLSPVAQMSRVELCMVFGEIYTYAICHVFMTSNSCFSQMRGCLDEGDYFESFGDLIQSKFLRIWIQTHHIQLGSKFPNASWSCFLYCKISKFTTDVEKFAKHTETRHVLVGRGRHWMSLPSGLEPRYLPSFLSECQNFWPFFKKIVGT